MQAVSAESSVVTGVRGRGGSPLPLQEGAPPQALGTVRVFFGSTHTPPTNGPSGALTC